MTTIINVIESQLGAGETNCSFTYLPDGEIALPPVSLREIRDDALKFAALLPEETALLLLLPSGISFIKAFFACLYAQIVAVPMALPSKNRGLDKLKVIAVNANASTAITTRETLNNLRRWFGENDLISQIRWILIEDIEEKRGDFVSPVKFPEPAQIAFLQYTSGSTGTPKGVMVTHENIIANSRILQTFFKNNNQSVSVCWLPSFHDMGLLDGIIQPIYSGFQSIMMSPTHFLQKPFRWLRALSDYGATYSGGPNFAFDLCVSRIKETELETLDLSRLHCLYNAAEPIRHQTMCRFLDKFSPVGFSASHFLTCYGLAEATLAATASKLGTRPTMLKINGAKLQCDGIMIVEKESDVEKEFGVELVSSGSVYCDTELLIIDPNSLKECAVGERGEIWVSGESVTAGYLNEPQITRDNFVVRDSKRFLRTGDLGFLFNNELFVTGRIKDLIIIRGTNHYPQDIEETVSNSHSALEANAGAAFSVEISGEEKLVIVQEIKRTCRQTVNYAAIFYEIMGAVSRRHGLVAHDIVLLAPNRLPKTSSGKIQRNACRRLWQSRQLVALAALEDHLFYQKISE